MLITRSATYEVSGSRSPVLNAQLTFVARSRVLPSMAHPFCSVARARLAAKDTSIHELWIDARQCKQFREPGWQELQPHLDGAALFIRRTTRAAS